jgi:hypothetical protein
MVLLSTPPDNPRTMPLALVFSVYSLMKRVILLSTSGRFNSRTAEVSFTSVHWSLRFMEVGKYLRTNINKSTTVTSFTEG